MSRHLFNLGMITVLREEKLNSEPVEYRLKIDLVSHPVRAEGFDKSIFTETLRGEFDTKSIFIWSKAGLNLASLRLITLPRLRNSICYTHIVCEGCGRERFTPFPRAIAQSEKQRTSSNIWTHMSVCEWGRHLWGL